MKRLALAITLFASVALLSGCIIVPPRHGGYYGVYRGEYRSDNRGDYQRYGDRRDDGGRYYQPDRRY